jgi:hypothetical protein|tara:strand:- start:96 stop:470 length:375 start_codon:yes stop_codon:yes gene_type:complete
MAYSQTINLVTGDTLPELSLTLKDSGTAASGTTLDADNSATWAPIDVTNGAVKVRIRELGSTTVKATLSCLITNASAGQVATNFPAGTLDTAGTFEAEIEITFSNGGIQTVHDLLKLKVRSDFD